MDINSNGFGRADGDLISYFHILQIHIFADFHRARSAVWSFQGDTALFCIDSLDGCSSLNRRHFYRRRSSIDSNRLREMALTSMVEARGRKAYAEEGALLSEAAARVAKSCSSTLMLQQFPILQRALADLSP